MLNSVSLQGRVVFSNYRAGEGEKKSFISFCISWQTNEKDQETGYYKEKLFKCKAWGQQADFINKFFPDKSQILIEGSLDVGNDYTNQNGELIKGGVEINVRGAHFCGNKEVGATTTNSAPTPTKPGAPKPAAKPAIKPNIKAPMPVRK